MARYGTNTYGSFIYGQAPQLALSVEPFKATALSYSRIDVTWTPPSGDFVRFRLLRNQEGISDTEEDGLILLDLTNSGDWSTKDIFKDGEDNIDEPGSELISGRYAYYSIWLLLTDNTWYFAGHTYTLLAGQHIVHLEGTDRTRNTHEKFMDLLPRVFTSSSQSALDSVDESSDLYNFLYGFSYTLDELLTYIDLLLPEHQYTNLTPELLDAVGYELNISSDNRPSTKFQRRYAREARWMYPRKGTQIALDTMVESITGWSPVTTVSPNLLLSVQDSTFYKGIGLWKTVGSCTLAAVGSVPPPTVEALAIDTLYTGEVEVTTSGAKIELGTDTPITSGIPVSASTGYTFSIYSKLVDGAPASTNVTLQIVWYSRTGVEISRSTQALTVSTSWAKKSVTGTSPATAVYAGVSIEMEAETYYFDLGQFAVSSITDFHEARAVQVLLSPTKINHLVNPSFENATILTGWTAVAAATAAESITLDSNTLPTNNPPGLFTGTKFLKVTGNTGATSLSTTVSTGIDSGRFYVFSIYAKAATGMLTLDFSLLAEDGGSSDSELNVNTVALTTAWQRFEVNVYVPTEYTTTSLTASISGTLAGEVFFVEAGQLEANYKASDYFDGSYTSNGGEWDGAVNNSASFLFQNKAVKMPRLEEEFPKFLPNNTPYRVESKDGLEFSGIS